MQKILMCLGIVIFMTACDGKTEGSISKSVEEIEEVPAGIEAEIISFNLEEDSKKADLITELTIKEKIEEVKEKPVPYTVFSAEVNEVFKGNLTTKEITIKQEGDSEWTVNNNKMFESGEKYILFLKETVASKSDYWILGEETGTFQILNDDTIGKLEEPIEELKDVEVDNPKAIATLKQKGKNNTQIINKKSFIEKINKVKGEK